MKRILSLLMLLLCVSTQAQTFQGYTKVVADANALQALNPYDIHQVVRMRGYASAAAADGAIFYFDTTSVTATNTVSVFKPTSVSGAGRWIRQDPMFQAGSTTVPSITFGLDSNTGFANSAADQIDIINGGLRKWYITSGGAFTAVGAQTIGTTTGDLTLNTGAANGNILLSPHGTGGVGIGATPSAGANSLKIGGTTASTTTATGSLINAGGFGNAGAANIGGVTAVTDTTEATTGGVAALKSSGGIYAAKKIVGNTDLIVNTSLLYADSAASKVGVGTTGPDRKLDVLDANNAQLRLSQADGTVYTDIGTLSTGHTLITNSYGGRITSTTVNDTSVLARQVQGGLAFDGVTASTKSVATVPSVGTSDITLASTFISNASQATFTCVAFLGSSGSYTHVAAGSFAIRIDTTSLLVLFYGATTSDYNVWTYAGFGSTYNGKIVNLAVTKSSSGNAVIYINGVDVSSLGSFTSSGTPPTWQGSITNTYLMCGAGKSDAIFNGTIFSATLFNRALSAAEVVTLANQGVQEADKWGSLGTAFYTGSFAAGTDLWGTDPSRTVSAPIAANADGAGVPPTSDWMKVTTGGTQNLYTYRSSGFSAYLSKRVKMTADIFIPAGSPITHVSLGSVFTAGTAGYDRTAAIAVTAGSTTTVTGDFVFVSGYMVIRNCDSSGSNVSIASGNSFYVKNVTISRAGAILDADLSVGVGYQVPDHSSNKYHGVVSATGTAWTRSNQRGQILWTTPANTSGNMQVLAQTALPVNALITDIVAYSTGTPTIYMGNASAGTNIVAAVALSASTYKALVMFDRLTTTGNLWINSSATNQVNLAINYMLANP